MTEEEQVQLLQVLEEAAYRHEYERMSFFEPYDKQRQFFNLGRDHRERLLVAGNQLGKTEAGGFETACHLTGRYPDWWEGRVWDRPVKGWAAGETGLVTRDVSQKKLCGEPGVEADFGKGYIPKDCFEDKPTLARGVADAYDMIQVIHSKLVVKKGTYIKTPERDGVSVLKFKSYEQGRAKFQGETLDFVWPDEEPDEEIYTECLTRTNATGGIVYLTFTPLKGMSNVVRRFFNENNPDRAKVTMTIKDAKHISPEEREKIIASYPAHEREARVNGVPMQGSGRIFPYTDESIMEAPILHVPAYWKKIWGLDFGIDHPFAAVLLLWDVDNDIIHVHQAIRVSDQLPLQHSALIKQIGASVPCAWPQDGTQRQTDGHPLSKHYARHGLMMLEEHATWPDGSISTEAGVMEMQERMTTGRLKVASQLSDWFTEFREYHRDEGKIIKLYDDLLSATRVGIMAKRYARPVALGSNTIKRVKPGTVAKDIDFDLS